MTAILKKIYFSKWNIFLAIAIQNHLMMNMNQENSPNQIKGKEFAKNQSKYA